MYIAGILEDSERLEVEGAVPCLWQLQVKKLKNEFVAKSILCSYAAQMQHAHMQERSLVSGALCF